MTRLYFRLTVAFALTAGATALVAACVGDDAATSSNGVDAGPLRGTEGGECFEDGTCKIGLECKSGRCVDLDGGAGSKDGGDAQTTDAEATKDAGDASASNGDACAAAVPSRGDGGIGCGDAGTCQERTETCCGVTGSGGTVPTCVDRDAGESMCLGNIKVQCGDRGGCDPSLPHCCLQSPNAQPGCSFTTPGTYCSATPCAGGDLEMCTVEQSACNSGTCQPAEMRILGVPAIIGVCK